MRRSSKNRRLKALLSLLLSKRAIAIPVTFMILFASLTMIISVTYYLTIAQIKTRSSELKGSAAKQEMLSLKDSIDLVVWSPGSSEVLYFDDCGGKFRVEPHEKILVINLTDNSFHDVVFNSSIGKAVYELPPSNLLTTETFLKGDRRVIVNQSSSTMTQLYISQGSESKEIVLCYRPMTSSSTAGTSNGKPVNSLRIYIVNLNSSQSIVAQGNFNLRITCVNVTSTLRSYNFSYQIESLMVKVNFDGVNGKVSLPVSSNAEGAIVKVEIVTCNVKLQKVGA